MAQIMIPDFDRIENILGKVENAGYQHCLLFPQCFQKLTKPGIDYGSRQDCGIRSYKSSLQPTFGIPRVLGAIKSLGCN